MTTPAIPPDVGAPLNKATINSQLGTAAQSFKRGLDELVVLYEWQTGYTTEMLMNLGFTDEEATLLKSGLGEVPAINTAVDGTSFLKRFWGTGV